MMVSKIGDPSFKPKISQVEQGSRGYGTLISKIHQLKKQIQSDRIVQIREKLDKNAQKLENHILSATSAEDLSATGNGSGEALYLRAECAICVFNGFVQASGDKDCTVSHEAAFSTSSKLPYVERIPPYTTWIFLDRNQRMAEDQSIVGRRRIYYDERGSEALICSDSDEENAELEEEKYEFSEGEDRILWMAFEEHGLNEEVVNIVSQFIGGTTAEIQMRFNELKEKFQEKQEKKVCEKSRFLEKSLSSALDSLDNLFCRRCLVFDCRLHGCSQSLIFPSEKQPTWSETEDDGKPCSDQCYLGARKTNEKLTVGLTVGSLSQVQDKGYGDENRDAVTHNFEEMICDDDLHNASMERCTAGQVESHSVGATVPIPQSGNVEKCTISKQKDSIAQHEIVSMEGCPAGQVDFHSAAVTESISLPENVDKCTISKQGDAVTEVETVEKCRISEEEVAMIGDDDDLQGPVKKQKISAMDTEAGSSASVPNEISDEAEETGRTPEMCKSMISWERQAEGFSSGCEWKPIERELFMKGLEIFGRNSCLIARNLLSGLKTCTEVFNYMHNNAAVIAHTSDALPSSFSEDKEQEMPTRARITRKRGRNRRHKYYSKATGHPSSWRRIGDGKHQICRQYTPCGCQFMCGKECPCKGNDICCEKYCGCSKSCKNRFRGCHCAKSQCKSRQCPCFASNRECDPDVCRNCWISCGDGSLGEPPRRSDGQCGNMKLLLRQQQQVLLARSDVAGWGAFIKNSVSKHDYLGEYTGELVSHREADKRGKIYDRANSSFLFDLNDQHDTVGERKRLLGAYESMMEDAVFPSKLWVLDAYRKGDKLKFANHSSNPNCYCKIMLVGGDHRVGIYAKEHIEAKEELFYDYRYGPNEAPEWARQPQGSRKDNALPSQGRPKKHQSH
ncbi:hypothetical protein Ancab_020348 [Ancistrocladus abbreviatus]